MQQRIPEREDGVEVEQLPQYLGREDEQRDDHLERLGDGDAEVHLYERGTRNSTSVSRHRKNAS